METTLNQLFATLWKCWRIRRKHYVNTIIVIFLPMLLYGIVSWSRIKCCQIGQKYVNTTTYIEPITEDQLYQQYKVDISSTYLLYAPSTKFSNQLMREVQIKMEISNNMIRSFDTEIDLLEFCHKNLTSDGTVYAVIFGNLENNTDDIPMGLNYTIRNFEKNVDWNTNSRFNVIAAEYIPNTGSEKYFNNAFINLQLAIDKEYLLMKNKNSLGFDLSFQEFPYPEHIDDFGFSEIFMIFLPLTTVISTIFIFPATLRPMLDEKESGIKELSKMMGLHPSVMYLGWFIDAFLPMIIPAAVCTILMKLRWGYAYAAIEYCNGYIYAIFLLLYFTTCIAFCLCVASWCDSTAFSTASSIGIWIIMYIGSQSITNLSDLGFTLNIILFLIPNFAMKSGFNAIALYELNGHGIQWNNLFSTANGDVNAPPLGYSLIMFLVDIIILLVFGFYIDQIRPGKHGLPKPWNFPFIAIFSKGLKRIKKREQYNEINTGNTKFVEATTRTAGIAIKNLTKVYGDKIVVNNLTVNFYEGEIAVLLGRNGAGKTTTMSVLTGMTEATHGNVWINNYDISENLNYVRTVIGICPQHNLLFPELTVKEHVLFFAKLHNEANAKIKVRKLLKTLNIYDQKNMYPQDISGGMKRKLCLAIAMISNPSVLILDEPTSGLDPKSRREFWDLILGWRSENPNATIMVSTHFMEEADVLGDRITIMDSGQLVAQGTPMYLKKEYANECHFSLILRNDVKKAQLYADCKQVLGDNFSFLTDSNFYKIVTENHNGNMIKLLEKIDNGGYVKHVGISIPSIEDVFLKLSSWKNSQDIAVNISEKNAKGSIHGQDIFSWITEYSYKFGGYAYQWKRYFPCLLVSIGMILLLRFSGSTQTVSRVSRPELPLQLGPYGKTVVYYSVDSSIKPPITQILEQLIIEQGSQPKRVESVSDALIAMGVKNLDDYKQKAVVALEFNATTDNTVLLNMMFSNSALHGAPIVLNIATNVIAKVFASGAIGASNHPIQTNDGLMTGQFANEIDIILLWVILVTIALLFLFVSYINFPFKERVNNFKHLVYMSGVSPLKYWLRLYFFQLMVLYLPAVFILCGILVSNPLYYQGAVPLVIVLGLYGAMMIPFVFLFSYKSSVAEAVGSLTSITIFTGLVCPFVIGILHNCDEATYKNISNAFHVFALIGPQYWLTNCLITFAKKSFWLYKWDNMLTMQKDALCKINYNPCCKITEDTGLIAASGDSCISYKSYFTKGLSPMYLIAVPIINTLFYFTLLCLNDSFGFHHSLKKRIESNLFLIKNSVWNNGNNMSNFTLKEFQVNDLKKAGGIEGNHIVDNVSFDVKPGHCYGLLGVNGAGKTTTFKMLTGLEVPTAGTANMEFSNEKIEPRNQTVSMSDSKTCSTYFKEIGYCPQSNAINGFLSAHDLLKMFAANRGASLSDVDDMLMRLGLDKFENIPCGILSGGNKRKLCLGISLIGRPSVVFLDEPTSGVDPVSRIMIWDILKEIKEKKRQSLVLTSHSMDECEKLCDFMAIMKKGNVHTKGSINELKLKHGEGLNIKIKLQPVKIDMNAVDTIDSTKIFEMVKQEVGDQIQVKDQHESLLHYFVPEIKCSVSDLRKIFVAMEKLKHRTKSPVEDYTISTSSLEDIFLSVADCKSG